MANAHWVVVDFKHPIDESTRTKLMRVLNAIDATARPAVSLDGIHGNWVEPPVSLAELCDLIHFCGVPCSGFMHAWGMRPTSDDRYESKPALAARVSTIWGRTLWPVLIECGFASLRTPDAPPPEVADTEPPPAAPLTDLELIARLRAYLPARVSDGWLWSAGLPELCSRFEVALKHTREAAQHITSAQAAMNQVIHEEHR